VFFSHNKSVSASAAAAKTINRTGPNNVVQNQPVRLILSDRISQSFSSVFLSQQISINQNQQSETIQRTGSKL
jgi:hypothetical protein